MPFYGMPDNLQPDKKYNAAPNPGGVEEAKKRVGKYGQSFI